MGAPQKKIRPSNIQLYCLSLHKHGVMETCWSSSDSGLNSLTFDLKATTPTGQVTVQISSLHLKLVRGNQITSVDQISSPGIWATVRHKSAAPPLPPGGVFEVSQTDKSKKMIFLKVILLLLFLVKNNFVSCSKQFPRRLVSDSGICPSAVNFKLDFLFDRTRMFCFLFCSVISALVTFKLSVSATCCSLWKK